MPPYPVRALLDAVPAEVAASAQMGDYSLTERDMRVAAALFATYWPMHVLEVGVCQGHTAAFLLDNFGSIREYVGVDRRPDLFPHCGIVPKYAGQRARRDDRFSCILTDESVEDLQRQLKALGHRFDCIIMDANHTEAGTRRDTEAVWPWSAYECLWIWHDYNVESRQNPTGKVFGVKPYIDGLIAQGRKIMTPDEVDRDPWKCVSLAWEVR
jgi:hypothetical protein